MTAPLIVYPTAEFTGKWHASKDGGFSPVAACRPSLLLDVNEPPIHVTPGQERVHPLVCKVCLAAWGGLAR